MRRPSRWGLEPGEDILCEDRIHAPLYYWILLPLTIGAFCGITISMSTFEPWNWPYFAVGGFVYGLLAVQSTRAWRWRITTTHLQQGYLGWPVYRFDSRASLAGFTSVTVLTGRGIHREIPLHLGDGQVHRWNRGAVIARLDSSADVKMVLATDTEAEAEELGAFLRARVEEAQRERGYTPPPDHNMRVLPSTPSPEKPS